MVKISPAKIKAYQRRWKKIESKLPSLEKEQVQKVLGEKIIINSLGGGCRCWKNYGKCVGLTKAGFPIQEFYGASAGIIAGFAFLNHEAFKEGVLHFAKLANRNKKNFYFSQLLKNKHPFPHQEMISQIRFDYNGETSSKETPPKIHGLVTRHWRKFPLIGYGLSLIAFGFQYGFARRSPLSRWILEPFFDHRGRGKHLDWLARLGIFPSTLTFRANPKNFDSISFIKAGMSLWPLFPMYKGKSKYHADGSLLANNCFPIITERHQNIDTLITLVPEPASGYHDRYLGVSSYRKRYRLSKFLVLHEV